MVTENDFVPFCNLETNVPTQASYLADSQLPTGNITGIARSTFINKALRQGTTIAAIVAQFWVDQTGANALDNQNTSDHVNPQSLLSVSRAAWTFHRPVQTEYTSGSGNHNLTYKFQVNAANATSTATYSDGTTTFTVSATISAANELVCTGPAAPVASGTLTKTGGTGDATITFYAARAPKYLKVVCVGGGGGGAGMATAASAAGGGPGGGGGGTCALIVNSPTGQYAYSVGAAGAAGAAAAGSGGKGGDTTWGGVITAGGGNGGHGNTAQTGNFFFVGSTPDSLGGTASGGDINVPGQPGLAGQCFSGGNIVISGTGGTSGMGMGSGGLFKSSASGAGNTGLGYGGGGSGGLVINNSGNAAGGAGAAGIVWVIEYFQ